MLVAGAEHWARYLPARFFAGSPHRDLIGHAPIWSLPRWLRRLRGTADITVVRVDRLSARLTFRTSRCAFRLNFPGAVSKSGERAVGRLGNGQQAEDLALQIGEFGVE